jgi:hypothetical protein
MGALMAVNELPDWKFGDVLEHNESGFRYVFVAFRSGPQRMFRGIPLSEPPPMFPHTPDPRRITFDPNHAHWTKVDDGEG